LLFPNPRAGVAQARLIGRERGSPCDIKLEAPFTGRFRTEFSYGAQPVA
jgi:hypothetical protein